MSSLPFPQMKTRQILNPCLKNCNNRNAPMEDLQEVDTFSEDIKSSEFDDAKQNWRCEELNQRSPEQEGSSLPTAPLDQLKESLPRCILFSSKHLCFSSRLSPVFPLFLPSSPRETPFRTSFPPILQCFYHNPGVLPHVRSAARMSLDHFLMNRPI